MIIIATAMVVTSKTSITCLPLTFLLQLVQFYPSLEETGKNCCRAFATSTSELKQVRTANVLWFSQKRRFSSAVWFGPQLLKHRKRYPLDKSLKWISMGETNATIQ